MLKGEKQLCSNPRISQTDVKYAFKIEIKLCKKERLVHILNYLVRLGIKLQEQSRTMPTTTLCVKQLCVYVCVCQEM